MSRRPTPDELAAAAERVVPDVLRPGLTVVFCGINPGLWSAATGHHFARPGNRFWRVLHEAGFTERQLDPTEEAALLAAGIGITNLVARASATARELSRAELQSGAAALVARLEPLRPRCVAVLGVTAYRSAFAAPRAGIGRLADPIAGAIGWLLANPSGAQARYQLADLVDQFATLHAALVAPAEPSSPTPHAPAAPVARRSRSEGDGRRPTAAADPT